MYFSNKLYIILSYYSVYTHMYFSNKLYLILSLHEGLLEIPRTVPLSKTDKNNWIVQQICVEYRRH